MPGEGGGGRPGTPQDDAPPGTVRPERTAWTIHVTLHAVNEQRYGRCHVTLAPETAWP